MFRHLLVNTVASASAFTTVSFVGFFLVPVLIGAYGLAEFGLIVLARVLLPTGLLALFDFGFSELATQSVAEARETTEWERASREVSILLALSAIMGLAIALLLTTSADAISTVFKVGGDAAASFPNIVRATGMALVVLFPALMLEGVVKGFAAFRSLRLIEIACTLAYAAAALAFVAGGLSYAAIAYAFLASTLLRAGLIAANAIRAGLGSKIRMSHSPGREELGRMLWRCKVMAQNRLLGVLQGPAQAPLVGALLGPTSVAIYDVLVRVPRFAKSAVALLGSALLPVAARLDAANDSERMTKLANWGMLLCAATVVPPLMCAALMSEPLLRLWVGPHFAAYWYWHALMFTVPVVSALIGFGLVALLARPHVLQRTNAIVAVQVAVQYALAFCALGFLQERAFLLAQAVTVAAFCPLLLNVLAKEHHLEGRVFRRVAAILAIGLAMAIVYYLLRDPRQIQSWSQLGLESSLWCGAYWAATWLGVLDRSQRKSLRSVLPLTLHLRSPVLRWGGTERGR